MFLRGSFLCVFFLAINVDHPEQDAELLRNLQAVYRRFCQEQGLARAFCANSALCAKPANALSSEVFSEVIDLSSGDVVQLVRTLPCHGRGRGFESRRPRHMLRERIVPPDNPRPPSEFQVHLRWVFPSKLLRIPLDN